MPEPPLILVTNDDGVRSPGLHAAAEAVAGLGDLLLVAPADALGIPAIAAAITAQVSEWRTFGTVDWTAARHFTRLLARQVLENGMPEEKQHAHVRPLPCRPAASSRCERSSARSAG